MLMNHTLLKSLTTQAGEDTNLSKRLAHSNTRVLIRSLHSQNTISFLKRNHPVYYNVTLKEKLDATLRSVEQP